MTEPGMVAIDDVRALVAERERFDDWLSALESRRTDTPAHVFERVHADYTARKQQVLETLWQHAPALSAMLQALDTRAESLAARVREEEDERAEAMLRHAVGEFDDPAWETIRQRVESTLSVLQDEREAVEAERADLRELLTHAPLPVGDAVPEPDHAVVPGEATGARPPNTDTATLPDGTPADRVDTADRTSAGPLAMADPVDASAAVASVPDRHAPAGSAHAADAAVISPASVMDTRAGTQADVVDPTPIEAEEAARTLRPDAARAGSFDDRAFLQSVTDADAMAPSMPRAPGLGEPPKTLRCTECSTMNLPTEWYCERCGGELASF
jgi:hypothetical protein